MSKDKVVTKEELSKFIPNIEISSLPMVIHNETENTFSDRELLYKMIFDIKHDLNDLKRFVWNMRNGNHDESKIDFRRNEKFVFNVCFVSRPECEYGRSNFQTVLREFVAVFH